MSISKSEKERIILELQRFHDGLTSYREEASTGPHMEMLGFFRKELNERRTELQRKCASLKPFIVEYAGEATMKVSGIDMDVFELALAYDTSKDYTMSALSIAILKVNTAIGKLQELNPTETAQIQAPVDSTEMANFLFNKMQFHPLVVEASKSLFESRHYTDAIFAAFKAVENFVLKKTGLSIYGKDLMAQVFNEDDPIIKLNELKTKSNRNEQVGFKFLFMGAYVGIRNPKAHGEATQLDPYKTLEYLGFASLLMRRADEGKLEQT